MANTTCYQIAAAAIDMYLSEGNSLWVDEDTAIGVHLETPNSIVVMVDNGDNTSYGTVKCRIEVDVWGTHRPVAPAGFEFEGKKLFPEEDNPFSAQVQEALSIWAQQYN